VTRGGPEIPEFPASGSQLWVSAGNCVLVIFVVFGGCLALLATYLWYGFPP
jgi:hypothetical protein